MWVVLVKVSLELYYRTCYIYNKHVDLLNYKVMKKLPIIFDLYLELAFEVFYLEFDKYSFGIIESIRIIYFNFIYTLHLQIIFNFHLSTQYKLAEKC